MKITVSNSKDVPNKVVRYIKYRLYKMKRKYKSLLYTDVHLKSEGQNPTTYLSTFRLGVPGNDIIIKNKGAQIKSLVGETLSDSERHLRKYQKRIDR